ncbi:DUF6544 family protein [Fulvivirga sedimenti]|uniref:Uncharacterized protein n=1 Tax=Fulvivirga sedimenti TaxID=2879465 RepID=A0A9X1HLE2_9BACT|nr:DUF6544 family protein [Fulvivirga sedimenti]MCA6074046.1 hypothetical protein [Fulvivirga sedimenti]
MRTGFSIIMIIHGLIHLLGFIKAFDITPVAQLKREISPQNGFFWGLAVVLFILAAVLCILKNDIWWIVATFAVLTSQILIFQQWGDARFGTIANLVILIGIVYGLANWSFQHTSISVTQEKIISDARGGKLLTIPETLPASVKQWLVFSNIAGTVVPATVEVDQAGQMKISESGDWMPFSSHQVFSIEPPGFIWSADVGNSLMNFRGRDLFSGGDGEMLIKVYGIYPAVHATGDQMNQATAIRFLSEIIWLPWAAVQNYISWEEIDDQKVKASFHWNDTGGFGIFTFDEMGRPVKFEAKRYYQRDQGASLENWVVDIDPQSYEAFSGVLIPTRASVSWELESGLWNWLQLEITDVVFQENVEKLN